jgi:diguanylate cyclase (GGDEF)-like protein
MSRSIVFDIRERKVFEQQLLELSTKDVLTGLSNRRHFYELASQSINLCERENTTLALAIVDIDHFKSINDKYGHYVGDIALKAVSEKMKSFLRCGDIVARIGGEEFAIILPKLDIHSAQSVLNRLRESIGTLTVQTPDDEVIHISVSIGVTEKQRLEIDIDSMISRADIALYHSKSAGRNRVSTG